MVNSPTHKLKLGATACAAYITLQIHTEISFHLKMCYGNPNGFDAGSTPILCWAPLLKLCKLKGCKVCWPDFIGPYQHVLPQETSGTQERFHVADSSDKHTLHSSIEHNIA